MAQRLNSPAVLRCGWFADAEKYDDGTPVAAVAVYNEFGTSRVPARPFVRPAIAEHGDRWLLHLGLGMRKVIMGKIPNVKTVMSLLGEEIVADLKDSIMRVWSPPLSPRTVANRRSRWNSAKSGKHPEMLYKPLVDTTLMINSTSYRVKGGD